MSLTVITTSSLVALASLTAACGGFYGQSYGAYVHVDSVGRGTRPVTTGEDSVRAQAASDLACPAASLVLQPLAKDESAYRVAACDHLATYVAITMSGVSSLARGYEGTPTLVQLRRYVLVSEGEPDAGLAELGEQATSLGLESGGRPT